MKNILSQESMREADKVTINNGVPSILLMKRAAEGLYQSYSMKGRIAIVSGLGNNGGDGFALSEILLDNEIMPDVFTFTGKMTNDCDYYYKRIVDKGVKVRIFNKQSDLWGYDIVVDCIFGTGGNREIRGIYFNAIEAINNSGAFIISADIPSGINGNNGRIMGIAVKASMTVSLGEYKTGHFLNDGLDYTGRLINCDIGINGDDNIRLLEGEDLKQIFPERKRNINKGTAGKLLIIGGSSNYMGAVILTESGAASLRVGAGLNCLAIPNSYLIPMMSRIVTSTLYPISDSNGYMVYDEIEFNKLIRNVTSIAVGMGMGINSENIKIIKHLINTNIPIIIDADGLNALSDNLEILEGHKAEIIMTPHPKEFSRLLGLNVDEILNNPIELSRSFAEKYNIILLLKGASTIVTDGISVIVVDRGAPNMAKGGSGDVLSGIIGGLLARGIKPFRAAYSGAYIAGRAGEIARDAIGEYSANPTDTVDKIAEVIREIVIN